MSYMPSYYVMTSQVEWLMRHFEVKDSISASEARKVYGVESLPRRIMDLKKRGYDFTHERKSDLRGKRYTRYILISRPE